MLGVNFILEYNLDFKKLMSESEEQEGNIVRGEEEERNIVRKKDIVRGEEQERNIVRGEEHCEEKRHCEGRGTL